MLDGMALLQIQNTLYVPEANKWLFSLIAAGQCGSMSQTMKEGTIVSHNGTPFIIGTPKSGKLHSFDMILIKNWEEVPRAIIAMLSDYTLWHRQMGHAHHHVIKHIGKNTEGGPHQTTEATIRACENSKRKVKKTSFPNCKIQGKMTPRSYSFWSGQNDSSLHWWIQVYYNLLRQLLFISHNVLSQTQKWRVCCIQDL